jgi:aryl-alcohol dehydrogenase-like predicted oxidoreductase
MFRQRPAELFFKEAKKRDIGIIVRVPLASGLLTGKFDRNTTFTEGDHRNFNRNGEAFDKGETFSGIDYNIGLEAVEELKRIFTDQPNLAPVALKWILMFDEVSCIIPGASKPEHLDSNFKALEVPQISEEQLKAVKEVYEKRIKPLVHYSW